MVVPVGVVAELFQVQRVSFQEQATVNLVEYQG
jgi:hypothetical protein